MVNVAGASGAVSGKVKEATQPLLEAALRAAADAGAADPIEALSEMLKQQQHAAKKKGGKGNGGGAPDEAAAYVASNPLGVVRDRVGWLLTFLFGLLLCASVMSGFEELLARELELSFFVPLLIGHGGNSGGQTVSTVIRALGSGAARLGDAPRIIFKEGFSGLCSALICVCALAPYLYYMMGISLRVTTIVSMTLPCLGLLANSLGSALPFIITYLGEPASHSADPLPFCPTPDGHSCTAAAPVCPERPACLLTPTHPSLPHCLQTVAQAAIRPSSLVLS
jgi:cation transporter-like permease